MADSYFTISKEGKGLVREKMSRFLSFAIPVSSVEEATRTIKQYQNNYHDARHVCWAYMIGPKRDIWQLNDNGEPSGTAGKPILGQINSKNITNVLVIVVRYFGGIKLGTSGLTMAYREAAREAIEDSEIIECHVMKVFTIEFAYEVADGIMKIIKKNDVKVENRIFDNVCKMTVGIREDFFDNLKNQIVSKGGLITE